MSKHQDTHVIVQTGGSCMEFYPEVYDSEEEARAAINSHVAATYNAFGPYKVSEALSRLSNDHWGEIIELIQMAMRDLSMGDYAEHDAEEVARLERENEAEDEEYEHRRKYVELSIDGDDYVEYDVKLKKELVRRPATDEEKSSLGSEN